MSERTKSPEVELNPTPACGKSAVKLGRHHLRLTLIIIFPLGVSECLLPVDVILQSSDGVKFGSHSKNLEIYSSAFPPTAFGPTLDEIVHLPESSEVVSLLLQYMHHHRQPDSEEIPFTILEGLAEAVEKYVIYSAMEVCKIRMK